jgi:hypothetical protein
MIIYGLQSTDIYFSPPTISGITPTPYTDVNPALYTDLHVFPKLYCLNLLTYTFPLAPHILHYLNSSTPLLSFLSIGL